jgi:putative glutamine amidotransferase
MPADIDSDPVRRAVEDAKIKARPVFHHRLPNCHVEDPDWTPAALVIGGGDDMSPEHSGGNLDANVILDRERDQLEISWIQRALEQEIPLLGICRGAQLINVALGGGLHPDIRPMRRRTHNRPGILPTKQVRLVPDSLLAAVCGKTRLRVNSLHHQAIKDPGRGLKVVGWDLDQITPAAECTIGRSIIGVQWHPEYPFYLPSQFALFRWLLQPAT